MGISDDSIADFIIAVAEEQQSSQQLHKALLKEGAEIPASLVDTLWNIIQRLKPGKKPTVGASRAPGAPSVAGSQDGQRAALYPALAIPNSR